MTTHVLQLFQSNMSIRTTYIVLFTLYTIAVLTVLRMGAMDQIATAEVIKWIVTAAFSLLLSALLVFLKRLIESIDRTSAQLHEHSGHIRVMTEQQRFQNEKIERMERVIERIVSRQA